MNYGKALLQKARKQCRSDYELARLLGTAQSTICEINKGKRGVPIKWVPRLALIAGIDPRTAVLAYVADGFERGSEERKALGKSAADDANAEVISAQWIAWLKATRQALKDLLVFQSAKGGGFGRLNLARREEGR